MTAAAAGEPGVGQAHMPAVLELPSATTLRFVLLAAAMLVAGLFIGVSVFGAVDGRAFANGDACDGLGVSAGVSPSSSPGEFSGTACLASFERHYALYAVGGAIVVAVGAGLIILVAPRVLAQRRRLRDPGPEAAAAAVRLVGFCADAGIRRPPRLLVGSATLRDAFSLGRPGRYAVALPLPLVVRSHTPLFEAMMRHELAHIRSHDVALAWLARAVWYSLAPLLLVPAVLFFLTGDGAILPDYIWRAGVVAVIVALAVRSALRSRELSADVAAARLAGPSVVIDALARVHAGPTALWRRLRAVHPGSAERIKAVQEPGRTAVVTITDGLVVGLLIGIVFPTLDLFFTAVLFGTAGDGLPPASATSLLLGPLAGATLGLGFWRHAAAARTSPSWAMVAAVLAGVAVGAVVGQLASFGGIGLSGLGGLDHPVLMLVFAAALTCAAGLTAMCAELLARVPSRRSAALATAAAIAICTTAIWAGDQLQGHLDQVTGPVSGNSPPKSSVGRPTAARPAAALLTNADYKIIASILGHRRDQIQAEMNASGGQRASAQTQVDLIDRGLVPDLQRLLDQAVAVHPADPATVTLHRQLIDSLQLTIAGYRAVAAGLNSNDARPVADGQAEITAATREFASWSAEVRRL